MKLVESKLYLKEEAPVSSIFEKSTDERSEEARITYLVVMTVPLS